MLVKRSGLALLILCVCIGQTFGQTAKSPPKRRAPGTFHNGKYIGFVPNHRRAAHGIFSQISPVETQSPKEVELASFETEILDGAGPCGGCAGCSTGTCGGGFVQPRFFGSAEYLWWWTKDAGELALATVSPAGTVQEDAAVLGQPGTSILFGDDISGDGRAGGRFTAGFWLNPARTQAIEVGYMILGDESESFVASNLNQPILGRPFFNIQLNEPDARLIAFPGLIAGNLTVATSSEFQAFEILLRQPLRNISGNTAHHHYGYRYAQLTESIRIDESTRSLSGPTQDAAFELFDSFKTKSEFHGGQIGMNAWWHRSPLWSVEFMGKLALGNTTSEATIAGQTTVTPSGGAATVTNSGLLTQESNIGSFEWDEFSTIFEAGITLHRELGCNMSASIGYSFLFWNDVARAGELVDSSVNPTQIPPSTLDGEARPRFQFDTTDFWAQGLRFGLNARY